LNMATLKDLYIQAEGEGDKAKVEEIGKKLAVVDDCRRFVEKVVAIEYPDRKEALEDLEFKLGKQWPDEIEKQRISEGRPCLKQNMIPKFLRQVIGESRLNKPSMDVDPVDDTSDPETAMVYEGLIRNIEYASNGQYCYESSLENAVDIGVGYWGYTISYADDDSFDQDIRFRRLPNPFAVYYDPNAVESDSSDASEVVVISEFSREAIKKQYGIDPADFDTMQGDEKFAWADRDNVRVAEYWRKEPVTKTLAIIPGPDGEEIVIRDYKQEEAGPLEPIRTRKVKTHQVKLYVCTGGHLLDSYDWPGRYIPVVRIVGNETFYKNRFVRSGMIRNMKDPQRTYNYWWTSLTEDVALAPKSPIIATPEMIKGYEGEWKNLNRIPRPYILYNHDQHVPGGPRVQEVPQIHTAKVQILQFASQGLKDTSGIYDASLGSRSNETSGIAIQTRQREGDIGNFHYIDNLHRGIRYGIRILIDLIPKVYSTKRVLRVLGKDERSELVPVNQQVAEPVLNKAGEPLVDQGGKPIVSQKFFDLTVGKYDIVAKVGPSFTTMREAATEQMTKALQAVPQSAPVLVPRILKNLNVEDADEIGREIKELMNPAKPPMGAMPGGPPKGVLG